MVVFGSGCEMRHGGNSLAQGRAQDSGFAPSLMAGRERWRFVYEAQE